MKTSKRIENMQFSPIRKLAPLAANARKNGTKVYGLNIGQPDVETPELFRNALKNFDLEVLAYSDSRGMDELLSSYQSYYKEYNINFEKEEMIVTNGGSEALLFAMMAICDPGEKIIIPEPFYTNYNSFSDVAGVEVVPMLTKAEEGFHLPKREDIEKLINEKTRGFLISNPGNPTGVVYTEEEIRTLVDIALKNDMYIIADEVYREFVYDGLKFFSPLMIEEARQNIILIDSVSKRYSACGARIGLIASKNRDLMDQIMKLAQARLCCPTVDQLACAKLIETPASYFEKVNKEYRERRDILHAAVSEISGVVSEKPTGAFYMMVKLPVDDADKFAAWLLTDFNIDGETIQVAPAAGFYATEGLGTNEIRLSYCINQEDLKKAANLLKEGVKAYNEKK